MKGTSKDGNSKEDLIYFLRMKTTDKTLKARLSDALAAKETSTAI